MKRLYATALVAALAAIAPAWGQPPANSNQVLTLTKDGKPYQYKVLKTYKHPSGGTACDVLDTATGEILTIVENATPEQVRTTLKPDVVTEVKMDPAAKAVSVPPPATNAIAPKPQSPTTSAPPPSSQYTRPPVSALKRWFGGTPKDAPPQSTRPTNAASLPTSGVVAAAYHPDRVYRLISSLNDDLLPSMREVAALELAGVARDRPEAVDALIAAASHDPAPSVRLCCVRKLGALHIQTPSCVAALQTLRSDRNPSVSAEAGVVLASLQRP